MATHNSRAVIQYSLDGKKIASFPSLKLASKSTGIPSQNIGRVCKGKGKTAAGYKWEYDSSFSAKDYYSYFIKQGGKRHPVYTNYIIFPDGRIFGMNGKFLKTSKDDQGYARVALVANKKRKSEMVHRLIAQTFIPNPQNLGMVNHKDGVVTHNHVENLEWVTGSRNTKHAYEQKLQRKAYKPVIQFTKGGDFVRRYPSIKDAAVAMGVTRGSMTDVCRGKYRSCKGYIFKYEEEKEGKDIEGEQWKFIKRLDGYEISNLGRVFSLKRGHVMKVVSRRSGHKVITIMGKSYQVHRLVAEAFVPKNDPKLNRVSRIDKDRSNVCAVNLKWI